MKAVAKCKKNAALPDANRRLMLVLLPAFTLPFRTLMKLALLTRTVRYITNLGDWTVPVLVLTTTVANKIFMGEFLRKHFSSRAYIGIRFSVRVFLACSPFLAPSLFLSSAPPPPPRPLFLSLLSPLCVLNFLFSLYYPAAHTEHYPPAGKRSLSLHPHVRPQSERNSGTFALAFHIPFHVWRTTREPKHDVRRKADRKTPMRKSRNLSFLETDDPSGRGEDDWLHQAQVSCLVTGHSSTYWTAFCCVDTYFDGDLSEDSIMRYDEIRESGVLCDPLTRGKFDADMPIWDPREYFLTVLYTSRTPRLRRVERSRLDDKAAH